MSERLEKAVILSFDEIRILLWGMDVRCIEGIYMPEKQFTDKDVIESLQHLSETGFIVAEDDGFVIQGSLREMLEIMAKPERTFVLRHEGEGTRECFCYMAQELIVVSERYWEKKNTLKLREFSLEEFYQWKEREQDDNCGC